MRSIRRAAVAFIVGLSPVALVGLEAPVASAASVAHPIVGDYWFTVHWTNPVINDTTSMDRAPGGPLHTLVLVGPQEGAGDDDETAPTRGVVSTASLMKAMPRRMTKNPSGARSSDA